jgi:hypothetical protein
MDPLTPVFMEDNDVLNTYPYNSEPVVTDDQGRVYGISDYVGAEVVNPLALLETQTGRTRVDKVVGNVFAVLRIILRKQVFLKVLTAIIHGSGKIL